MNTIVKGTLLLSTLLIGSQAYANNNDTVSEKNWSLGVGSYASTVTNTDDDNDNREFSGFNIAAGYAVNNYFQIRGTLFVLESDSFYVDAKSKGLDIMLYGGMGLSRKGFRVYGGPGFYSEKWYASNYPSKSFSGYQLGVGLGYNWGPVAADFVFSLRQVDKYEGVLHNAGTYMAASGNLTVSYQF